MLNRHHFLLFVFMLIPTPGVTLTDYELAQRLIGQWSLTSVIPLSEEKPKSYLENYTLSDIREDPLHLGTYQVWGTNQFGEPVIAQYDSEKQEYRLAFAPNPTDPIIYNPYEYYTFTFVSAQTITGCHYEPDSLTEHEDGTITPHYGKCASLTGTLQPLVIRPTQRPVAQFTVTPNEGYGPLTIQLDGTSSFDPDGGELVKYQWNIHAFFAGLTSCTGSALNFSGPQVSFTLPAPCSAEIKLRVTDDEGFMSTARSDEGETPLNIRAFQSPHNQLPQVPGTPNYRLDLTSLTWIVWRERQPDGTYFPFIRIIPKIPPPPPFVNSMTSRSPFVFGNGPFICGLSAEQQGVTYESPMLRLNTKPDGGNDFCDYLMEPATFFLDQWSIEKNFNDTQAFSLLMDGSRLEVPAVAEGQLPQAEFTVTQPTRYTPTFTITLDASQAHDPDGHIVKYQWAIDERFFFSDQIVSLTFDLADIVTFFGAISFGTSFEYQIRLTVIDQTGLKNSTLQIIKIPNLPLPILTPSQTEYHAEEKILVTMPKLSERQLYLDDYVEYVGIIFPTKQIYLLDQKNQFTFFDETLLLPWQGGEVVLEGAVTSELPRGKYRLYLVLAPKHIDPWLSRPDWIRWVNTFTVTD